MELFAVNRYNASGKTETETLKENEDAILQTLLKKVEKRKRKLKELREPEVEIQTRDNGQLNKYPKTENDEVEEKSFDQEKDQDLISAGEEMVAINESDAYKILGDDVETSKTKVDMVLPSWLAHPSIISTIIDDIEGKASMDFPNYLTAHIRQSLKDLNITRLFPVQKSVVPWILTVHSKSKPFRPRDICVSAPTGSGKTLAFAIPIVQLLATRVERKIRALVVLPVAELALQVFKVFKKLCERTDLTVCLLSKQFPFPLEQENLVEFYKGCYHSKVDIVVTTPGRLVDHLHATKGFCFKALQFLVIDEADRIMDAVFQNWLYHLDSHVKTTSDMLLSGRSTPLCLHELEQSASTEPHKLLFSATLSQDPEKLQNLRLFQPKLFTSVLSDLNELRGKYEVGNDKLGHTKELHGEFIGKYTTPAELTEKYCITESRIKPLTLYSLVNENSWTKFLCFTNSAESSGRLAFVLRELFQKSLIINELSASINAKERAHVLSQFARGKVNGLVCSDALARGIDIPDVDIVISYDPPRHIKTYIHRIGRTARAGRQGTAITLLTQKELNAFNHTVAEVGKVLVQEITLSTATEEDNAKRYAAALESLRAKLEKDKRTKMLKKQRSTQKALVHKDPKNMTLMEKLQAQAQEFTQEEQRKDHPLSSKKKPSKTFRPKKFNPSAGKREKITK